MFKPTAALRQLGITQRRVFESRLAGQTNQARLVETRLANADLNLQRKAIERLAEFVNQLHTDGGHAAGVEDLFDDAPTRLVSVQPPR